MTKKKTALITGITGQDGSYLAELLLEKGYDVHGLVRHVALESRENRFSRLNHILPKLTLHTGDVLDYRLLWRLVARVQPDEMYHLVGISTIAASFQDEFSTFRTNEDGTLHALSALKELKPDCRFFFAASREIFGQATGETEDEKTPVNPSNPYGISKATSYFLTKMYREIHGMHASSAIMFNHESPRRGHDFVTRKISSAVARIKLGLASELGLGNLDAEKDWGYAVDYVEAMWLMLQQDKADDYVLATGESHSLKEFVEEWQKTRKRKKIQGGQGYNAKALVDTIIRENIRNVPQSWRTETERHHQRDCVLLIVSCLLFAEFDLKRLAHLHNLHTVRFFRRQS